MNGMPFHCYLVPHVPIELLKYKAGETEEWETLDWYIALREDIKENGLTCPILVNMLPGPYNRFGEYGVSAGHHRVGACKSLGWTHIPCVIYGAPLPRHWEMKRLKGLCHVHDALRDGAVKLVHEMFWMNGATLPETMKYPKTDDPYWPSSPIRSHSVRS